MNVAVTGGVGLTGQCAVKDLLRSDKVDKVVVADLDAKALRAMKKRIDDGRVFYKKVDVTKHEECVDVVKGSDVVINAVQYYFNLDVMACALRAKTNYLDFGGLYHTTLKQRRSFHKKYEKAGLLGILGMGAQPGVSNLMIKHALGFLETADTVEIRDGWRDLTKTESAMYFTWSPQTFFDESARDAIVFRNGRYETRPPFSEPEEVEFPGPVGRVAVYLALHSELATVPSSFAEYGVRNVSWKEGGADFWKIKFLADLGLTSDQKISVDGARVPPRRFLMKLLSLRDLVKIPEGALPDDFEVTRVNVYGRSVGGDGARKKVIVDCYFTAYKPWRVSCSQYNVGIPGSVAAQKIALEFDRLPRGALPPEKVFARPLDFFQELKKRGMAIKEKVMHT